MAKSDIHKDQVFNFFKESGFRVNLFYKPTMKEFDYYYHIIIDSVIVIQLRLLNDNFITITGVTPLTSEYIESKYEALVKAMIKQDVFTIIIEKLGNTQPIINACVKLGLPCVVDNRFISIPKKLYNMYLRYYKEDESKCGFYIAAAVGDLQDVKVDELPEIKEPEVIIKEVIKEVPVEVPIEVPVEIETIKYVDRVIDKANRKYEDVENETIDNQIPYLAGEEFRLYNKLDKNTDSFDIIYDDMIIVHFGLDTYGLNLLSISLMEGVTPPSNVYYMKMFGKLEDILQYYDIVVKDIRNETVFRICQLRDYEKIPQIHSSRRNFGSFKMRKLQ